MSSVGVRYACTACRRETLRWEGRCPTCGEWNSLVEARRDKKRTDGVPRLSGPGGGAPAPLSSAAAEPRERVSVGLGDLDLVLGGGMVPGSLVLLGGAPGIGKSTLLLQLAARIQAGKGTALYVSGEESAEQVRLRAARLGGGAEGVRFLAETEVGALLESAAAAAPALLCVDSVQTLRSPDLTSAPGTVNQVRECAGALQAFAKATGTTTFLVGHVTKGGGLAGPRTLEHLVDVVLHVEGPGSSEHRILRAAKNRFGSVGEVAVFRMTAAGLSPVEDPATAFLVGRRRGASGSAVAVPLEGSRPLLAEVQALTAPSRAASPGRMTTGFPSRRLSMLLAVLERRAGLRLSGGDVFVNVAGGLRLGDPAADLAVVAAVASAELDRAVPGELAFIGEVGLGGEVRAAARMERRLREVARGGLSGAVLPLGSAGPTDGLRVSAVEHVGEVVDLLRGGGGA